MVRFGIAGIQKTKLFKVKGEKTNFSVIDVFYENAYILKTKHTANVKSIIFGISTLRASIWVPTRRGFDENCRI